MQEAREEKKNRQLTGGVGQGGLESREEKMGVGVQVRGAWAGLTDPLGRRSPTSLESGEGETTVLIVRALFAGYLQMCIVAGDIRYVRIYGNKRGRPRPSPVSRGCFGKSGNYACHWQTQEKNRNNVVVAMTLIALRFTCDIYSFFAPIEMSSTSIPRVPPPTANQLAHPPQKT